MQFWTATLPILFVCLFLLCRCSMSIPMSFVKRTIRTLEFNNIIHLTNTCGTTIQMLRIVHLEVLENSTNTHHHQLNAHAQFTLHSAFRIISAFSIRCHPSLFYSVYKSTAIVDCRRQKLQRMTLHLSTTHFQLYIYTLSIRFDPIFPYKYSSVLHYFFSTHMHSNCCFVFYKTSMHITLWSRYITCATISWAPAFQLQLVFVSILLLLYIFSVLRACSFHIIFPMFHIYPKQNASRWQDPSSIVT